MSLNVNILILNYNGEELLKAYLPSFQKAVASSAFKCRLGVIDNQSRDQSVSFLKTNFPDVDVHLAKENKVLCSYNPVAAALTDDILIFMNNDILVDENFIDPLVKPFLAQDNVFFVTPKCLSLHQKSYEGNKTRGRIRYGVFWSSALYEAHEAEIEKQGLTFAGGFGAFHRKKFLELGGYDDLFLPGRLEDTDLCFRAYKRGWKSLYEPKSIVYHQGGVSFHKVFGIKQTLVINWRNTFLFMAKNLSDARLIAEVIFFLPLRLIYSLLTLKPELFFGFINSFPLLPSAFRKRKKLKKEGFFKAVPDHEIFDKV